MCDQRLLLAGRAEVAIKRPFRDLLAHLSTTHVCGPEVDTQPHPCIYHFLNRHTPRVIDAFAFVLRNIRCSGDEGQLQVLRVECLLQSAGNTPMRPEYPLTYSGYGGVTNSGAQFWSAVVAGLPSVSARWMAEMDRQKL